MNVAGASTRSNAGWGWRGQAEQDYWEGYGETGREVEAYSHAEGTERADSN